MDATFPRVAGTPMSHQRRDIIMNTRKHRLKSTNQAGGSSFQLGHAGVRQTRASVNWPRFDWKLPLLGKGQPQHQNQ